MSQFLVKVFGIFGLTRFISQLIPVWFLLGYTQFTLTKEHLALTKSDLHTLRVFKTFLLISLVNTQLNLTNCWLICTVISVKPWFVFMWGNSHFWSSSAIMDFATHDLLGGQVVLWTVNKRLDFTLKNGSFVKTRIL